MIKKAVLLTLEEYNQFNHWEKVWSRSLCNTDGCTVFVDEKNIGRFMARLIKIRKVSHE